jgi:hypothetical protein
MNAQFKSSAVIALATGCVLLGTSSAFSQVELRVDIANGTTTGTGANWGTDAIKYLQDALVIADGLIDLGRVPRFVEKLRWSLRWLMVADFVT